jgi:hypothetical protein
VLPLPKREDDALRYFLASKKYIKIGHHIAYDKRITEAAGYTWGGEIHDTMVMAHVVTAGDELAYALKPISKKWLRYPDDDERRLEDAVKAARIQARAKGYLIAGGKKEVERGDRVVFAGSKPVKADYWLVPSPMAVTTTPHDLVRDYGVGDSERAMLLFLFFWPILESDRRLMATYRREMALFHELRHMELAGTRVYPRQTDHLVQWYIQDMKRQQSIGDAHGGWILNKKGERVRMNYNSSPQLIKKFYVERGYPIEYKERKKKDKKTGAVTTKMTPTFGKDQLAVYGAINEETGKPKDVLAKAILEFRAGRQTISAFLNIYKKFWYPEGPTDPRYRRRFDALMAMPREFRGELSPLTDAELTWLYRHAVWVLHPNYNQCGAVTGRLTCSDPNLQQVASATTGLRKSEIAQRPRECFGPRPGHRWYLPDYSQIEVWLFAFMSGEPAMQQLLLSGYDFHQGVADKSFTSRADYQPRKKYYRKLAKLIMFGKLYGGGVGTPENPGRMTRLLQMPFDEAKAFIDSFEEEFSAVKEYMRRLQREAKRDKEAWNTFGRKYVLDEEWAYKVVNYMIQGTAADMLKLAILRVAWMLRTRYAHPTLRLLNNLHDELIIEVPNALHSVTLQREIAWVMQMDSARVGIPVPVPVGMKATVPLFSFRERQWAQRWSDTKDLIIRSDAEIEYWRARGKIGGRVIPRHPTAKEDIEMLEKFQSTIGGVPYLLHEQRAFAPLARHMAACPYNQLILDQEVIA